MFRIAVERRLVDIVLLCLASSGLMAARSQAKILSGTMFSRSNGRNIEYWVYVPPGYNGTAATRYPVVYSLHGEGGTAARRASNYAPTLDQYINSGQAIPMIWVFPDGQDNSYYGNAFDGHKQVYSNIIGELVSVIDSKFKTVANRSSRALEGFSMGGFGSGMLAATNTQLFSATVLSGAVVPTWEKLLIKQPAVAAEMYDNVEANWLPYSLWDTTAANSASIAATVNYKMLCGELDGQLANNQKFANYLRSLGIKPQFQILPGVAHGGLMYMQNGTAILFLSRHFRNAS